MPRKKRPLDRDSGLLRDANLIVIASEDTYAAKAYFARFRTRRTKFIVLPTEDGRSSPGAVLQRLDEFKAKYATEENDQFWLCIDQDHWAESAHIGTLIQVLRHCADKQFGIAISNPCFELWMLLHFESPDPESCRCAADVMHRLKDLFGGYNKTKCCGSIPIDESMVRAAIDRAEQLDDNKLLPESPHCTF